MDYSVRTRKKMKEKAHMVKRASVGAELHHLDEDKSITTDPGENSKRRTLKLIKKQNSWGFTLQTYGIKHKKTNEIEIMTYVDYVEFDGAAWLAGMRRGDEILSVNGEKVVEIAHQQLVNKIRQAGETLRLVVLFEDCCRKVDLHERFLKLKAVLKSKYQELKEIEQKEMQILENYCQSKGLNRFEQIRHSIMSNGSSNSDSWDAYSVISSPNGMLSTGNYTHSQWSSVTSLKSYSIGDTSSIYEDDCSYIDSESDSDGITFGNPVSKTNSDSDLVMKSGTADERRVKDIAKFRTRSSDSRLYRKSPNLLMRGPNLVKETFKAESLDSIVDEVFIKEDDSESAKNATILPKHKMFYKGENGTMIVPKICIDGEEMYTTFDEIDSRDSENVQSNIPEIHQDKIVAIEIAKEMARLDKLEAERQKSISQQRNETGSPHETDTCASFILSEQSNNENIKRDKNSPDLSRKLTKTSTGAVQELKDIQSNGAKLKYSTSLKQKGTTSPRTGSPKSERSIIPGIGGSMSYEQLKSSVPDIRVSFHTDECEVIYINEKDEVTKL
ncbi:uncharacterized protein LOC123537762 [Mercenaria mercenaria]|uniref:uncharacterized protein LOC123537762 n=1 Tax=Mercenaria mercenaria TaxID=6596 RepID=UPI00234F0817|nr:uncharacterized protein LOC123537762 [Mercenaria mercenaria]